MKKIFILLLSFFCCYGCKSVNSKVSGYGFLADLYSDITLGREGLFAYMIQQYCNDENILPYKVKELHVFYTLDSDESNKILIKQPHTIWERFIGCTYNTEVCNQKKNTLHLPNTYQILTQTPGYITYESYDAKESMEATRNLLLNNPYEKDERQLAFIKLDIRDSNKITQITPTKKITTSKVDFCLQYYHNIEKEYSKYTITARSEKGKSFPLVLKLKNEKSESKTNNVLEDTVYTQLTDYKSNSSYTSWLGTSEFLKDIAIQATQQSTVCSTGKDNIIIDNTSQLVDCKKVKETTQTLSLKEVYVVKKE